MNMKLLESIARSANTVLMIFVSLGASVLMVSGLYVLNDIRYTNRTAFISYDLLQYRPLPKTSDNGVETRTISELKEINSDTVGWLEIFGTNINYPVVQGENNLEYLNKDIFGYNTLSGSIYLASENQNDFSDWYNIIYGHHMENGAMFGDIEKYLDPEYFASHSTGVLQTPQGDYSINIIACVKTNAYENAIYQVEGSEAEKYPALIDYIRENSVNHSELPETLEDLQIIGMSTCTDAATNGRIVLFASVKPWDNSEDGDLEEIILKEEIERKNNDKPLSLTAVGHSIGGGKWSFLNLLCVLCTFLTLLPIWSVRRKYGQFSYSRKKIKELEKSTEESEKKKSGALTEENTEEPYINREDEEKIKIADDLKHFIKKGRTGLIAEFLILAVSVTVFILTEDLKGRMSIRDKWTGMMIIIAALSLAVDFICMRYRGERPEKAEQA